jgi:DNA-binding MarR family transcriptional regulator
MVRHVGGEKGIAQNELSRLLLVTTSNMTRMIDKIEKDGFAGRLSQKGDRRINLIKITKEGADLLDAIWPHYKKKVDDLIGSTFSKSEKQKINGLLERLIKNIESPA